MPIKKRIVASPAEVSTNPIMAVGIALTKSIIPIGIRGPNLIVKYELSIMRRKKELLHIETYFVAERTQYETHDNCSWNGRDRREAMMASLPLVITMSIWSNPLIPSPTSLFKSIAAVSLATLLTSARGIDSHNMFSIFIWFLTWRW